MDTNFRNATSVEGFDEYAKPAGESGNAPTMNGTAPRLSSVADYGVKSSETIGKLVAALAAAQLEFDTILKENVNPAFRSKYSDLATVIAATQPALAKMGLVVFQMTRSDFGDADAKMLTVTTMLAHSSGEWIASDLTLPAMMRETFNSQSVGSAITYGRRYGLQAILGVSAEEDDDANKASDIGSKDAAKGVAQKVIEGSRKVTIAYSEDRKTVLFSGAWQLLGNQLRANGASFDGVTKVWTIPPKAVNDILKDCKDAQLEVTTVMGVKTAPVEDAAKKMGKITGFLESWESKDTVPKDKAGKPTGKPGRPFLALIIDGVKCTCFDNRKMPMPDGTAKYLFILIAEAKGQHVEFAAIESKGYINIERPLIIGNLEWDWTPEGEPVSVRRQNMDAEPPEYTATDEDLPSGMFK